MRNRIALVLALLLSLFISPTVAAQALGPGVGVHGEGGDPPAKQGGYEWIPCIIHCHTNFSDGFETVGKLAAAARAAGARVLVVTDHFEDIWLEGYRSFAPRTYLKGSGWENYVNTCREASDAQLAVVPGVEVGIGNPWDPYRATDSEAQDKTRKVHLLGIGLLDERQALELASALGIRRDGRGYAGVLRDLEKGQAEAAWRMSICGLAVVIAHPWLKMSPWPWEVDDLYTYYRNQAANISGVEFFNGEERDSLRAMGFVDRDPNASKQRAAYGVTAGSDFHGWHPGEVGKFVERITWVRVPAGALGGEWEAQCRAIAAGVRSGYTVAGIGELQRGDTLQTWLKRVRGGNTAVQAQFAPFQYLPGRLIGRPGQWEETEGEEETEGRLVVTSTPTGARVFVDGVDTGETTPCTVLVPAGDDPRKTVVVKVTLEGYADDQMWYPINAGLETRASFTLEAEATTQPTAPVGEGLSTDIKRYAAYYPPDPSYIPAGAVVNMKDGSILVPIPAGQAILGSPEDEGYSDERPQFRASLPGYYIGLHEVTNAQWKRFVAATGHDTSGLLNSWYADPAMADHPVVCVSWEDVEAYCRWAGLALPTELQWEKAARGSDGREYPWGNPWDPKRSTNEENSEGSPTPVYTHPAGRSPYGLFDMAGNVWEWCADRYDGDAYERYARGDLTPPANGGSRVLRGGSWNDNARICRSARRYYNNPGYRPSVIGFRVARDL